MIRPLFVLVSALVWWGCVQDPASAPDVTPSQIARAQELEADGVTEGKEGGFYAPIVRRGPGDFVVDLYAPWPDNEPTETLRAIWLRDGDGQLLGFREFDIAWTTRASFRLPVGTTSVEAFAHSDLQGTWSSGLISLAVEVP